MSGTDDGQGVSGTDDGQGVSGTGLSVAEPRQRTNRQRRLLRRLLRRLGAVLLLIILVPLAVIVLYRFVDPPITPLMVIRMLEGEGLERQWVPLAAIAPHLRHAVIAAEDNTFCRHNGFDWPVLEEQIRRWRAGDAARGASTISMQTAKNILLWPGRDPVRKAIEVPLTALIELVWPKHRIFEVYLNIAETGAGRYGVEAAARAAFQRPAATLTRAQAALIATALPAPRRRAADRPSPTHAAQARTIERRIVTLGPAYFACVDTP